MKWLEILKFTDLVNKRRVIHPRIACPATKERSDRGIWKKTSFLAVVTQVRQISKAHVHSSSTKELARRPKNGTSKWSKVSTRAYVISVRSIFRADEQLSHIGSSSRETSEDSPSW
jgi:hypothetical protein